jgi:hypothetical protein
MEYLVETDGFWVMIKFKILFPFKGISLSKELSTINRDISSLDGSNKLLTTIIITHSSNVEHISKSFTS